MKATCEGCVHSVLELTPDKSMIRQCRFNPPVPVLLQVPQQTPQGVQIQIRFLSAWPTVENDHHCSQFKGDFLSLAA